MSMDTMNKEVLDKNKNTVRKIQEKYNHSNDLVEMVHSFLSEEDAAESQKRIDEGRIGNFYPSSTGRCKRAVVYQLMGFPPKKIQGQSLLIMANGTSFHERMESIFERMGLLIAPELSLKDKELKISGRSDAIIWNYLLDPNEPDEEDITLYEPEDKDNPEKERKIVYAGPRNHILIVELKSIKSSKFAKLKTQPLKNHLMQLQLYFHLTGIRRGILHYENKDTQEIKVFYISYDEAIVNETLSYINEVIQSSQEQNLPEREGNPLDIMCRYCDFRNICHEPISEEDWLDIYFGDDEAA